MTADLDEGRPSLSELRGLKETSMFIAIFFSMSDLLRNGKGRREVEMRSSYLQLVVKRPATSTMSAPRVQVVEENDREEGIIRLAVVRAAA